jgi:hypothetical protein
MSGPEAALHALGEALRSERSVVSPHVREPGNGELPVLGVLAAAGPRAAAAPAEYALIVESVREGYLLHYGQPRLVAGDDADLGLLAGDYLYALALERLAALGDLDAVADLSDLISLAAQVHDGSREESPVATESGALWLATATAVGAGTSSDVDTAKAALRAAAPDAAERLWVAARARAHEAGLGDHIQAAAQAIDFAAEFRS